MPDSLFTHPALQDFILRCIPTGTALTPVAFTEEENPIPNQMSAMCSTTVFSGLYVLYKETAISTRPDRHAEIVEIIICTQNPTHETKHGQTSLRFGIAVLTLKIKLVLPDGSVVMSIRAEDCSQEIPYILVILKDFTDTVHQLTTS